MRAFLQLVSAPLNPIPIAEHFRIILINTPCRDKSTIHKVDGSPWSLDSKFSFDVKSPREPQFLNNFAQNRSFLP